MHKRWKQSSVNKQFLETLLFVIKMCIGIYRVFKKQLHFIKGFEVYLPQSILFTIYDYFSLDLTIKLGQLVVVIIIKSIKVT